MYRGRRGGGGTSPSSNIRVLGLGGVLSPVHYDRGGEHTHNSAKVPEHSLLLVKVGADAHRLENSHRRRQQSVKNSALSETEINARGNLKFYSIAGSR